jgi:hypothetical protein
MATIGVGTTKIMMLNTVVPALNGLVWPDVISAANAVITIARPAATKNPNTRAFADPSSLIFVICLRFI